MNSLGTTNKLLGSQTFYFWFVHVWNKITRFPAYIGFHFPFLSILFGCRKKVHSTTYFIVHCSPILGLVSLFLPLKRCLQIVVFENTNVYPECLQSLNIENKNPTFLSLIKFIDAISLSNIHSHFPTSPSPSHLHPLLMLLVCQISPPISLPPPISTPY